MKNKRTTPSLITELINYQKVLDLSDRRLAIELGISHVQWGYIKAGKRRIGIRFLKAVVKKLPQFYPDVIQYLSG